MQISLNLEVCRGNRVDRRKTFDSKIFYDQHNKFSVEINCYHRVRFHSIVTMVTRDVRVLNMSLSLPSATCRIYTWSTNRVDLDQGGYKHHAALSSVAMVAMCEYCHAVGLYYLKKNSLGSNPCSNREDLFFMNKIAIIIMPYRNRAHPFAFKVHRKVPVYRRICTYTCVPNREVIAMFGWDRDPIENLRRYSN